MDESTTKLLHYGHLGKPVYHRETQSWEFSRTLAPPPQISCTGVTKTTVQSPSTSVEQSLISKRSIITRGYPELIAGYRLAHSETLSHTITATSKACDPLVSTLLDLGRAVDFDIDTSGRRAVPIVAFASGECGNIVSLRTITEETVELEQPTVSRLRVPTIDDENHIEWLADVAPIRQICFSYALDGRATFMAVRFSSTVVFRPLYHRTPTLVPVHRDASGMAHGHQVSRLDPNFLMEITMPHTGGAAHADVRFNPWNQNQLAIVDEDGNWSIWELRNQHKRNRDNWVASCVLTGTIPWVNPLASAEEHKLSDKQSRHDGWLAVEWADNGNHIVVCDRRCSILYRVKGDEAIPYAMEIGYTRQSEWILGVQRSTCEPSHIFLLTTSRIVWFEITPNWIPADKDAGPSLVPLLSWRHFRDSDDTTLQLAPLTVNMEFYLAIFSRLNGLVLAFYCSNPPGAVCGSTFAFDPFVLHVPLTSNHAEDSEAHPMDMPLSTLVFREIVPGPIDDRDLDRSLRFIKAFAVDSGLRVLESLYSKTSTGGRGGEYLYGKDVLRGKDLRLSGLQKKGANSRSGFIVDDWDESVHVVGSISDRGIGSIVPWTEPHFALDYTHIYAIATGSFKEVGEGTTVCSFQESIQEVVDDLAGRVPSERPRHTVLEILRKPPVLDDIDQNAQYLAAFVSQFALHKPALENWGDLLVQPYGLFSAHLTQQADLLGTSRLDLVAIYDRLVNEWLIDLPSDMPGRARISKEKAIRRFVVDLVLSQIINLHIPKTAETMTNHGVTLSTYSNSDLVSSSTLASEQSSHKYLSSSTKQGVLSHAHTATTQSSSAAGDSTWPKCQGGQSPPFAVLSSYSALYKTEPMSQDAERILGHWKAGLDPASYSPVLEKSRSADSNQASQHRLRKKNVSQSSKSMSLDSPKPPTVSSIPPPVSSSALALRGTWGSQPDNGHAHMAHYQSSQVVSDVPMTQIERGTFGGREAGRKGGNKAKKKKRAAGF
ncbi:uncharacterized protein DSM5745_06208 [Aspergillus mulundensis]|uniref:RNA polymerase I-specific transcription initiation factor RRN6-like protein n=1 Tax=Aspergillus mulundensis TaxID=1810919 RepID=A0A3D8RQK0_9EURO|nr:hypothetical protein DSM5745_06208 [Aspergillus mulundensis]RDW76216.1 hypothetical protein DSM5745_06208 [Aspergillus mulundensis]